MDSKDSACPNSSKKNDFFSFKLQLWGLLTAAGAVAAVVSMASFAGQFAWWLDIWSHFRLQYAIGFAVLAFCYFLGRKKRFAVIWLCMFVLNAVPILLFLLPLSRVPASYGTPLKALLINVNTKTGNPANVIGLIEHENPDIIVLEEINNKWVESLSPLLKTYPFQTIEAREDNFGIALLARHQTQSAKVEFFGSAKVPSIVAAILWNKRPLTIIATHPLPPAGPIYSALRNEQLEQLAAKMHTLDGPVLLLGDLNTTPWSYHYRTFLRATKLKDSSKGRGLYPTWPTFAPPLLIPLDHALHTDDIVILQKKVGPNVGSDHYPIIVDFAFSVRK